jgi:hypothetical protein
MTSINATFKPSSDGSIHLPIPPELHGTTQLRVVAWLEAAAATPAKSGAGEWAVRARGIAQPLPNENPDEARMASLRKKFVGS